MQTEDQVEPMEHVLDSGYVILVDYMGDDLRVANAARVSFGKRTRVLRPKDSRLIKFLAENGHTSPYRHNVVTFEVHAPMMVVRQLQRYVIGGNHSDPLGAWSEMSLRYVMGDFEFYVPQPNEWRLQAKDRKQGSDGTVKETVGAAATSRLINVVDTALDNYTWAINAGVAGEQARLFLPANALYTTWWMTLSLQAACWLFHERMRPDAMRETREYAQAMYRLVYGLFPEAVDSLMKHLPGAHPMDMEDEDAQ
jgi:thymidylate synthase (FAD)